MDAGGASYAVIFTVFGLQQMPDPALAMHRWVRRKTKKKKQHTRNNKNIEKSDADKARVRQVKALGGLLVTLSKKKRRRRLTRDLVMRLKKPSNACKETN
jgi:hypothetical protein